MPSLIMSPHEGGGAWPGGVWGLPSGPLGGKSLFGDGQYGANVIQGGSVLQPVGDILTVTGAATVVPDAETGASVVTCGWLIVDGASASLAPSTNSKGLVVFARYGIIVRNSGRIHIDKLGKAGNFGNLTAWDLVPAALQAKLSQSGLAAYTILGEGAAGGSGGNNAQSTASNAGAGGTATALKTGGGGGGGGGNNTAGYPGAGGAGGKGGPCCGGAGGGGSGGPQGTSGYTGYPAGDYGGPGGNGRESTGSWNSGGGAGDPVGVGSNTGQNGQGAGGGLLMLFAPSITISSGCVISADGANGGTATGACAGGAGGGGCVVLVTKTGGYSNAGTVRANGGVGGTGYNTWYNGGAGGAGSVNTFTVS